MFARHGSRYLTKEKKYAAPLSLLLEADEEGVLTPDGKRVLKVVASLAQEAEGRYGELTPKGAQQHREFDKTGCFTVTRRCFSDGTHVDDTLYIQDPCFSFHGCRMRGIERLES